MSTTGVIRHPSRVAETVTAEDLGKLLLRLAIGALLLLHGLAKVDSGPGPVAELLVRHELPAMLAYLVYVGEVAAPVLLILGLWTQPAGLVVAINMMFAIGLAHASEIFTFGNSGGWALELQGLYLFGALAIVMLGAGRVSVGGLRGRWN